MMNMGALLEYISPLNVCYIHFYYAYKMQGTQSEICFIQCIAVPQRLQAHPCQSLAA